MTPADHGIPGKCMLAWYVSGAVHVCYYDPMHDGRGHTCKCGSSHQEAPGIEARDYGFVGVPQIDVDLKEFLFNPMTHTAA